MTCDQALLSISARMDGEATPEEVKQLELHLAGCPHCRALDADLNGIHSAMEHWEEQPQRNLTAGVMERISATKVKKFPQLRRWGALAAVFALVVLSAGSLKLLENRNAEPSEPVAVEETTPAVTPRAKVQAPLQTSAEPEPVETKAPVKSAENTPKVSPEQAETAEGVAKKPAVTEVPAVTKTPVETQKPAPVKVTAPVQQTDRVRSQTVAVSPQAVSNAVPQNERAANQNSSPASAPSPTQQLVMVTGSPFMAKANAVTYCGVLTLDGTGPLNLTALEPYRQETADGAVQFLLPAQRFRTLVTELKDSGVATLRQTGADISSAATSGLVVVTAAQE